MLPSRVNAHFSLPFVPSAPAKPALEGRPGRYYSPVKQQSEIARSQEWLDKRFSNIYPEDFCHGGVVLFYTALSLDAPSGFESVWGVLSANCRARGPPTPAIRDAFNNAPAVVLLADVLDKEQVKRVMAMSEYINSNFGDEAPVIILVLHTVSPEFREPVDEDTEFCAMAHALENGVDEVVIGELEGLRLAWEVQSRTTAQAHLVEKLGQIPRPEIDEEVMQERKQVLEDVIHDTVWEYLRVRVADIIPEIDPSIPAETPHQIDEYRVGIILGKGTFGRVHQLLWHDGQPTGTVVKMMLKKPLSDLRSLCAVKEQIRVMQVLTDDWPHPNITKLYNIYHSETHLHFQLEDGGFTDLYRYFILNERKNVSISPKITRTIVHRLISAVCHMHINPKVAHCDLKPENIIITETGDDVSIKVSDFDTAKLDPKVPCRGLVGTFPFSAPEIMLTDTYDPYAIDIWSLGLVIMEVLCFMHVLEEALHLSSVKNISNRREKHAIRKKLTTKIRHYFSHPEAVDCLLEEEMRPELQKFTTPDFLALLAGMLNVIDTDRLKAPAVVSSSQSLL